VRAIVTVDLFGLPAPVDEIVALSREQDLCVVDDAAQALGGRDAQGRPVGAVADATCFSFFPTKNLGAWGDGGAVVTARPELAERLRRLRVHGATAPYVHGEIGRNSRLDALQAAVLLTKARHFERWMQARARVAARYLSELAPLPVQLPSSVAAPARHGWHAFVVRTERRDALATWLRERGIETRVYYPVPLHRQPCFPSQDAWDLPVAERACRTALALPMYPALEGDRQASVIGEVKRFFG
jgi:dTDP-4-amino-4,6-dideoxygalactose transaminase